MGPLPFSALGPFFERDGLAGDGGSEPSRLWMVELIDGWWDRLGRPDPFTVVELGAGDGSRARDVLGIGPRALSALRYVVVEEGPPAARLRSHNSTLPVEDPAFLFPSAISDPDDPDEVAQPARDVGPVVTSLGELPVVPGPALVVAIRWVGRMPSDRVEWRAGQWLEVRLGAEGERLEEVLVPLDPRRVEMIGELLPPGLRSEGARFAVLVGASAWMASALSAAGSGALTVVDRWTRRTERLDAVEPPALALDQLGRRSEPLDPDPVDVDGSLSFVTWSLV
jgi:Putative S-adenosyl-L-methionine-dependent methyltransferase